jgi:hypothetical protein
MLKHASSVARYLISFLHNVDLNPVASHKPLYQGTRIPQVID